MDLIEMSNLLAGLCGEIEEDLHDSRRFDELPEKLRRALQLNDELQSVLQRKLRAAEGYLYGR